MANPNGRKGAQTETDSVNYLREQLGDLFPQIERREKNGIKDRGDVTGIPNWVIEVKNEKTINLAGYMGELETEIENDKAQFGFAIVKRRGKNIAEAYAVTPLRRQVELVREITRLRAEVRRLEGHAGPHTN